MFRCAFCRARSTNKRNSPHRTLQIIYYEYVGAETKICANQCVGLFWRCADINTKCWPINTYKCINWTFTLDFLILLQWNCDFQSFNFVIELIIELSLEHAAMYLFVVWPLPVDSIQPNNSGIVSVRRSIFVFNFNSNIACRAYKNRECHSMEILNTAHILLI